MKKYIKMIGELAFYYAITLVVIFSVIYAFDHVKVLTSLYDVAPPVFFGFSDPILVAFFFLFFKYVKKQKLTQYANIKKISVPTIVLVVAIGTVLGFFSFSFVSTNFIKINCPELNISIKGFTASGNLLALLYLVPMNSFYKEVSYRGVFYNEVRNNNLPVWVALIIPALMYCTLLVISGNVIGVLVYSFLGNMLFGTVYYWGKSVWASMLTTMSCTFSIILTKRIFPRSLFTNQHAIIFTSLTVVILAVLMGILYKQHKNLGSDEKNKLLANEKGATV